MRHDDRQHDGYQPGRGLLAWSLAIVLTTLVGCGGGGGGGDGGDDSLKITGLPSGDATSTTTMTLAASGGSDITGYAWDFGDGGSDTGATTSHTWSEGTWTITLTVTHGSGLTTVVSETITVDTTAPTITFEAFEISGTLDEAATVTVDVHGDEDGAVDDKFAVDLLLDDNDLTADPGGTTNQVYMLDIKATDPSGNVTDEAFEVELAP